MHLLLLAMHLRPFSPQFHASNGALTLAEDIKRIGISHPHTRLVPDLSGGIDPDDVFR
jgi:leukotriene-A4 hydrolase